MSGPKIGELFAGYGGLGMGVQAVLDGEIAWFSEFDKGPSKILEHRFPGVPNHGDITKIDWSQVEPVDILTGGSPCQDLSHAGKRQGMTEGTRSNLWVAMREAIAQLRPGLVVWENVRGTYSAGADSEVEPCPGCVGDGSGVSLRALGRVLGDLSDLGYDASWHGLRAADVGAPHGRFRVFVVAQSADQRHEWAGRPRDGRAGPADGDSGSLTVLPTQCAHGMHRNAFHCVMCAEDVAVLPTPTARDWKNVGDPAKTAARMADRGQPLGEIVVNALLPTPVVNDMGEGKTVEAWDEWTTKLKASHGNGNGHGPSLSIEAQRLDLDESRCVECGCPEHLHDAGGFCAGRCGGEMCGGRQYVARLLPTPRAGDGEKGGPNQAGSSGDLMLPSAVQPERWGQYAGAIHRWEHLTRPAPAPTETGPKGNLRLSAAFSEWMMGLPAGWVTDVPGITRNEALKALGNGVCPQQCAAALREMFAWAEERAA